MFTIAHELTKLIFKEKVECISVTMHQHYVSLLEPCICWLDPFYRSPQIMSFVKDIVEKRNQAFMAPMIDYCLEHASPKQLVCLGDLLVFIRILLHTAKYVDDHMCDDYGNHKISFAITDVRSLYKTLQKTSKIE